MKWFEGGIPNAIQTAKNTRSVFIVFISGENEASTEMESYLHAENVTDLCEKNKCVAVKLDSKSNDCKFFSQIYPVVVIPSAFFIGDNGTPLEVIGECKSPEQFLEKVEAAIELQNKSNTSQSSASSSPEQPKKKTEKTPVESSDNDKDDSESGAVGGANEETVGGANEETVGAASEGNGEGASPEKRAKVEENVEDRVERARQLIKEKQDEKMRKEAEDAKNKEKERRNVGQSVQVLRQNQKEMDMLEAKKELKKDKEDDKIARQRVKEQIARDRAEKNARFNEAKVERDRAAEEAKRQKLLEQQATAAAEQARRSDICRIQFRLPDGSSVTQQFPATDTFASVFEFIAGHAGYAITLSTSFPRRMFTQADHGSTLQELSLAPSAVILVLPRGSSKTGTSGSVSAAGITQIIFYPFIFLWNLVSSLFGLSPGSRPSTQPSSSPQTTATGGDRNPGGARPRDTSSRQVGAIHRFHNAEDDEDDEDRTTWNGNSTQQM